MTDSVHIVELIDGYGFTLEEVAYSSGLSFWEVEKFYNEVMTFLNKNDRINNTVVVKASLV